MPQFPQGELAVGGLPRDAEFGPVAQPARSLIPSATWWTCWQRTAACPGSSWTVPCSRTKRVRRGLAWGEDPMGVKGQRGGQGTHEVLGFPHPCPPHCPHPSSRCSLLPPLLPDRASTAPARATQGSGEQERLVRLPPPSRTKAPAGQTQEPGSWAGTAALQKVISYLTNKKPLMLFCVGFFFPLFWP